MTRAPSVSSMAEALRGGQRRALARAITLIESSLPPDRERAEALLEALLPVSGNALRVAISGVPGVGKSTWIDALGMHALGAGRRVAVLSIDPSSSLSGGSILGDKTRMPRLAREPNAFIRPTPSGRDLGGVARRTREVILLVEAAGYDLVIVETVGVGQSETLAAQMTDAFVLMLLPASGDELQGIKRGIVEVADWILINKADGAWQDAARHAAGDYRLALQLMRAPTVGWQPQVLTCSALSGDGIDTFYQQLMRFADTVRASGVLAERRAEQARQWLWQETRNGLLTLLQSDSRVRARLTALEAAVATAAITPPAAARELLELVWQSNQSK